jgi:CDGSH-type Zn-finger protein/uncharacterized Fe-S cluster protein YjdI
VDVGKYRKYSMANNTTKTYKGSTVNVSFDSARCSHSGNCLRNLPSVFNLKAKPWINLGDCDSAAVMDAVSRCPSGALQFSEACDENVSLKIVTDGPLELRGDITLKASFNDAGITASRLSLCRCGLSKNKPYCDGSHRNRFKEPGNIDSRAPATTNQPPANAVSVICVENGPLMCKGNVELRDVNNTTLTVIDPALCRCGASGRKPFCDGSHNKTGFKSTNPESGSE